MDLRISLIPFMNRYSMQRELPLNTGDLHRYRALVRSLRQARGVLDSLAVILSVSSLSVMTDLSHSRSRHVRTAVALVLLEPSRGDRTQSFCFRSCLLIRQEAC